MSSLRITLLAVPASALLVGLSGCAMETADTPEEAVVGQSEEGLTPTEEAVTEDGKTEETTAVSNENGNDTEWWGRPGFGWGRPGFGWGGFGWRRPGFGFGYPGFGHPGFGYPGFGYGFHRPFYPFYRPIYPAYPYYGYGGGCFGATPCLY